MTPSGRDAVQFTRESAERIANVVRAAELTPRGGSALNFDPMFWTRGASGGGAGGKVFRVCTFTGAWSKSSAKVVTFRNQTATPNTVSATNLFANIATASGSRNCAIARDGTAWYLIAAEC